MRLSFQGERVLAVVAHPDDAEILCTGTLARVRRDGGAVGICILCQGEKGQPEQPIPDLAAVRKRESEASAGILSARLFPGRYPDGTLRDVDETRMHLVRTLRTFRPTLVLAHAPNDYHPDHQAASSLAQAASWIAASRGVRTEDLAPLERPPALWWMDALAMTDFEPTIYIDVSEFVAVKDQMLACHESQLRRATDRDFVSLADLMHHHLSARGLQADVPAAEAFRPCLAFKRIGAW
jgi:LmbE family N-acetylglucosaminyl deacetylase